MLRKLFTPIIAITLFTAINTYATNVQWGYKGKVTPDIWGKHFKNCKPGGFQSPINIDLKTVKYQATPKLQFSFEAAPNAILNNSHTIMVYYTNPANTLTINGSQYHLVQFHFHSPSENTINGKYFPLSMHWVYENKQEQLAVIGVMFKQGTENPALKPLWQHIPQKNQSTSLKDVTFNPADLLPKNQAYVSFEGSLTTPPCSHGAQWFVMRTAVDASAAQIKQFQQYYSGNVRHLKTLNDRKMIGSDMRK